MLNLLQIALLIFCALSAFEFAGSLKAGKKKGYRLLFLESDP